MVSFDTLFGEDSEVVYDTQFQLLILANTVTVFGIGLISPLLDTLVEPFNVSAAEIGWMISSFTIPGIVVIPLAGILADRYGRKPILITGLLLYGTGGALISLTTDFRIALSLRLLQGIGFAGTLPIIVTSLGDQYQGTKEVTAQGLRFTSTGVSSAFFSFIAGLLVVVAWQYPFLLYGLAIPITLLIFIFFKEPSTSRSNDYVTEEENKNNRSRISNIRLFVFQQRTLLILIARGLPHIAFIAFLTYNSTIIIRLIEGTPQQAGILVATNSLIYASVSSQVGRITSTFDGRFYPLVVAHLCLSCGLGAVAFSQSFLSAVFGTCLIGAGSGISFTLYRSIITGFPPEELRSSIVSIGEAVGQTVNSLTPILIGLLISVLAPTYGLTVSIRWTVFGAGLITGISGLFCLIIIRSTTPFVLNE